MNRVLITGNEGFVGNHIQNALETEHEVVGLEAKPTFREWYNEMYDVMDTPIDAVIHVGAIAENQSDRDDIYLWNSYATFLLAQRVRQKMNSMSPIPFVFFSSYLVESTTQNWEARSPYTWSKAQAENFVRVYLPHAAILRPGTMWGNEERKRPEHRSVPCRLAAHQLEYLFRNWSRYYVHVEDVVSAVQVCLEDRHKGTYSVVDPRPWANTELAKMVKWSGYEWVDNPKSVGMRHVLEAVPAPTSDRVPNWKPCKAMEIELPRLEGKLNG